MGTNTEVIEIKMQSLFINFFQEASEIEKSIGPQAFHIIGFYRHWAEENNIQSHTNPSAQEMYDKGRRYFENVCPELSREENTRVYKALRMTAGLET